jgi:uncharacterized membrane protein YidH (DUF202 family)
MKTSRKQERFVGLFIAAFSTFLTIWTWQTAIQTRSFPVYGALLGPAMVVVGLGLIAFPHYRRERLDRGEDISQLNTFQQITPRWWVIQIIAMGCSLLNLVMLTN